MILYGKSDITVLKWATNILVVTGKGAFFR